MKELPPKLVSWLHSNEFLAVKYGVEFITCFAIVAGVIRHW